MQIFHCNFPLPHTHIIYMYTNQTQKSYTPVRCEKLDFRNYFGLYSLSTVAKI